MSSAGSGTVTPESESENVRQEIINFEGKNGDTPMAFVEETTGAEPLSIPADSSSETHATSAAEQSESTATTAINLEVEDARRDAISDPHTDEGVGLSSPSSALFDLPPPLKQLEKPSRASPYSTRRPTTETSSLPAATDSEGLSGASQPTEVKIPTAPRRSIRFNVDQRKSLSPRKEKQSRRGNISSALSALHRSSSSSHALKVSSSMPSAAASPDTSISHPTLLPRQSTITQSSKKSKKQIRRVPSEMDSFSQLMSGGFEKRFQGEVRTVSSSSSVGEGTKSRHGQLGLYHSMSSGDQDREAVKSVLKMEGKRTGRKKVKKEKSSDEELELTYDPTSESEEEAVFTDQEEEESAGSDKDEMHGKKRKRKSYAGNAESKKGSRRMEQVEAREEPVEGSQKTHEQDDG